MGTVYYAVMLPNGNVEVRSSAGRPYTHAMVGIGTEESAKKARAAAEAIRPSPEAFVEYDRLEKVRAERHKVYSARVEEVRKELVPQLTADLQAKGVKVPFMLVFDLTMPNGNVQGLKALGLEQDAESLRLWKEFEDACKEQRALNVLDFRNADAVAKRAEDRLAPHVIRWNHAAKNAVAAVDALANDHIGPLTIFIVEAGEPQPTRKKAIEAAKARGPVKLG